MKRFIRHSAIWLIAQSIKIGNKHLSTPGAYFFFNKYRRTNAELGTRTHDIAVKGRWLNQLAYAPIFYGRFWLFDNMLSAYCNLNDIFAFIFI